MTKIVVVSDNHGLVKELEEIYFRYKDIASYFLHCGDSEMDENHPIFKIYKAVNGNCDEYSFPNELILEVENNKILVVHGHYHSVKYDLSNLLGCALEKEIDIVLFGHTHYPIVLKQGNITFVNPGSILANRGIRGRSYAVIDINHHEIKVKHYDAITHEEYIVKE